LNQRILPFISLDCNAVNDFLASGISQVPARQRELVYGRAMARLLAHELYHFLTQTTHHTKSGIAKAKVNAAELLADHFDFDREAFARLRASVRPDRLDTAAAIAPVAKPTDHGL
jgi:hypothetical protein